MLYKYKGIYFKFIYFKLVPTDFNGWVLEVTNFVSHVSVENLPGGSGKLSTIIYNHFAVSFLKAIK